MAKWLDRTLLTAPIYYCLCLSEADFQRELRKLKVPKESWPPFKSKHGNATANFLVSDKGSHCCIVSMRKGGGTREEIYGLLIHEAVHIWQEVREIVGERSPASEQEAYAVQHIAQRLIESYRDQTKRK